MTHIAPSDSASTRGACRLTVLPARRPSAGRGPEDGFQLHETVVECTQYLKLAAAELTAYGLTAPSGMRPDENVVLEAGSTFVLDEYGDLKFDVANSLPFLGATPSEMQNWQRRLEYMWQRGYLGDAANRSSDLAAFHLQRSLAQGAEAAAEAARQSRLTQEAWT